MTSLEQRTASVETHLSQVFLTEDRVYKLLKPVRTSFVDFSDRDRRMAAATAEYELNRRLSPDVYLGVFDIEENDSAGVPQPVDRMIVMRRLPAARQLDRLIDDPKFFTHLREVARLVATFHSGQPPVSGPASGAASIERLNANWDDNFDMLAPLAGTVIPVAEFERAKALASAYLSGRGRLFEQRIVDGWVRDGHGDLRCEHVFCLDDGPRLIDCLAFRDDFRIADVLNDVAFLAMDIHRLAGPAAAKYFIDLYDEFAGEHHPSSLAHHYVAYRASVRAKVAAIRFGQGDAAAAEEVLIYHRLALEHLELGQTRLILVGGGAGVGKSTVAGGLSDRLAATWLRADEIRKDQAGLDHDEHAFEDPDCGIYSPESTERVYREMIRQAEMLLARGESVILDASWSSRDRRTWARSLARRTDATLVELRCVAPQPIAKERIVRRLASIYNPSDATPEIADHLAARFDPWPEAETIGTDQAVAGSIGDAYSVIMTGTGGTKEPGPFQVRVDEAGLTHESIGFFLARFSGLAVFEQRPVDRR